MCGCQLGGRRSRADAYLRLAATEAERVRTRSERPPGPATCHREGHCDQDQVYLHRPKQVHDPPHPLSHHVTSPWQPVGAVIGRSRSLDDLENISAAFCVFVRSMFSYDIREPSSSQLASRVRFLCPFLC